MARIVLGTQTFIDLAATDKSTPRSWLDKAYKERGIDTADLAISVASSIALQHHFADLKAKGKLDAKAMVMMQRCASYEQEFREPRNILAIDDAIIATWKTFAELPLQYFRRDGSPYMLGLEEKLVIATAITLRLTLLERAQPVHARELLQFGLRVEDPNVL